MSEWPYRRLQEVATRIATKNNIGVERVLTVSAERGLVDQEDYFTKRVASSDLSNYWVVMPGDFVYNKSTSKGAPWGVVAQYKGSVPAIVTPLYIVFRARTDAVERNFLELACNSTSFFSSLQGSLREGARAHGLLNVRLSEFFDASLPVPDVNLQQRIVATITAVDDQIAAVKAGLFRLRNVAQAVTSAVLEPQPHWRDLAIGEVARPATGRAFPNRFQGAPSGTLPYFKVADMGLPGNEREMRVSSNWLTDQSSVSVKPRICPEGTVVFPIIGAALRTEKRRILVRPSAFDQNVMGLIPSSEIDSRFLFACMNDVRLGTLAQAGALPSINQSIVARIRISLPPIEEQSEIGQKLDVVYEATDAAAAELSTLQSFRTTLLANIMNQSFAMTESTFSPREGASQT